jgi:hypothetical protein
MPQVLIKIADAPETVGPALNTRRAALIKAVLTDAQLITLCTNGGLLRYVGCSTQLAYGRQMVGEMAVAFGLTYVLRPTDL